MFSGYLQWGKLVSNCNLKEVKTEQGREMFF